MTKKIARKKPAQNKQELELSPLPITLTWQGALSILRNRVFKIKNPKGYGTGFHIGNFGNGLCAVATALHVVDDSYEWGESMKLVHDESNQEILLDGQSRSILIYPKSDLAIIVFKCPDHLSLPSIEIEHLLSGYYLNSGVEVAWCGYPQVKSDKLCFFHGYISCHLDDEGRHLVDGVAINGVSGGPVFYIDKESNKPIVAGVITAYIANRTSRDTLPGLSQISLIPPEFEENMKYLRTLPQVVKEAEKIEEKEKERLNNEE